MTIDLDQLDEHIARDHMIGASIARHLVAEIRALRERAERAEREREEAHTILGDAYHAFARWGAEEDGIADDAWPVFERIAMVLAWPVGHSRGTTPANPYYGETQQTPVPLPRGEVGWLRHRVPPSGGDSGGLRAACSRCDGTGYEERPDEYVDGGFSRSLSLHPCPDCAGKESTHG